VVHRQLRTRFKNGPERAVDSFDTLSGYAAVRDNLATLLAEASELGRGLPRYVERDFARYLECGVLAHGFARVRCERCKDELLVAFSCKGRGVCPSCNAKRAHVTAAHLVERVLPHVS
jgi:hypothetical protein